MDDQGGAPAPKRGPPGPPPPARGGAAKAAEGAPKAAAKKVPPSPLPKKAASPPAARAEASGEGGSSPPANKQSPREETPGNDRGTDRDSDLERGDRTTRTDANQAIRILYLHSMEASHDRQKVALLEETFGKSNVKAPPLGARRTVALFGGAFVLTAVLMICLVCMAFVKGTFMTGIMALCSLTLVSLLAFFLAWRGVTQLIVRQAVLHAEAAFKTFKPNVIVAPAYGAVVAFQMDSPKLPLVLLSPAQDVYYRYMHLRPLISLADYPYTIVVSGSKDSQVPLDDAIRLVETAEIGRCRLEVVDDDHGFSSLRAEDFRTWVEEAFQKGGEIVRREVARGNKHFDASLFDPYAGEATETESVQ